MWRSSGPGNHQAALPNRVMTAGTSRQRTIVASIAIATASPTPNCLTMASPLRMKLENTHTMISAAEVITRPVFASPSTAEAVERAGHRPLTPRRRGGQASISGAGCAAGGALAAQRHIVGVDRVVDALGEARDRALEVAVLECRYVAARLAYEVVVVLAARVDRLVARDALGHVHPPSEPQVVEQVERAVDRRDADVVPAFAQVVGDLPRGHAAAEIR